MEKVYPRHTVLCMCCTYYANGTAARQVVSTMDPLLLPVNLVLFESVLI